MKLPKRTLDQYALIKSHSGIVNSESNLMRMKNQMMMAKSLGEIEVANREIKETKLTRAHEMLKEKAPIALEKLSKKKGDVCKLYKGEMCSLLFVFYREYIEEDKIKKPELANMLREKIRGNCDALQRSDLDLSELFRPTAEPTSLE